MTSTATENWTPASGHPNVRIAALDGAEVGVGVRLATEVGALDSTGALPVRAYLDSDELGRSTSPMVWGRISPAVLASTAASTVARDEIPPALGHATHHWVELTACDHALQMEAGPIEMPEAIDLRVLLQFANLVPPGGQLGIEYDSAVRRLTARALAANVPPLATPLGGMLHLIGCGVLVRPSASGAPVRLLRGMRPVDREHEQLRAPEVVATLQNFMDHSDHLDWDIQAETRGMAEAIMTSLGERFAVSAPTNRTED